MSTQTATQTLTQVQAPTHAPAQTPQAALAAAQKEVARLVARQRDLPTLYSAAVDRADGAAMATLRRAAFDLDEHLAAARIVVARAQVAITAHAVEVALAAEDRAQRQSETTRTEGRRALAQTPHPVPETRADGLAVLARATATKQAIAQAEGAARAATHDKRQAQMRHAEMQQALCDLLGTTAQRLSVGGGV